MKTAYSEQKNELNEVEGQVEEANRHPVVKEKLLELGLSEGDAGVDSHVVPDEESVEESESASR